MRPHRAELPTRMKWRGWVAAALAVALLAAACLPTSESTAAGATVVTVFGPWRGRTADNFRAALAPFEARTGIDVRYTGTGSFAELIVKRLEDGDPPDVAMFPQPGMLADLAARGLVLPLRDDVGTAALTSYHTPIASYVEGLEEQIHGILYGLNLKSLVWYPPQTFAEKGYQIPTTWDEMDTLAERMIADGFSPWCLGVAAFDSSGWPATDWVEDIVLRFAGIEIYDEWVAGDIPFTDDAIRNAFARFQAMTLQSGRAVGGRRGALNTPTGVAQDPMFDDPRAA